MAVLQDFEPRDVDEQVKPPTPILVVAAIFAVGSFALFALSTRPAHALGYGLGTFFTIIAVALFRRADARRSTSPLYSSVPWLGYAAIAILVFGMVCGLGHIYYIAQEIKG